MQEYNMNIHFSRFARFYNLAFSLCSFAAENFILLQGLSSTTAEHQGANFRSLLDFIAFDMPPNKDMLAFNLNLQKIETMDSRGTSDPTTEEHWSKEPGPRVERFLSNV